MEIQPNSDKIPELTSEARAFFERCAAAEQCVRDEIWGMEHSEDMARVLRALEQALRQLGVDFLACGVNIVEERENGFTTEIYELYRDTGGFIKDYDPDILEAASPLIVRMWKKGQISYRPDLEVEDPFGEKQWMDLQNGFSVRSVLDQPFSHGTLALSSEKPNAFSWQVIETVRRMARVLSEGFSRRSDLQKLEREVHERRRVEGDIRTSLAVQQVRNVVLQMQSEKDWEKVAAAFNEQLSALVDFYLCGIIHIDKLRESYQAQDVTPPRQGKLTANEGLPMSLREAVESGRPVYRGSRAEIDRYGDRIGPEVNSVVDVPFRGGTIAVNSKEEGAFAERDIRILEEFAQVMSEAHVRLEDLQQLRRQEEQLRQAQKMEAVGQLTAGIAHNFNNALAGISVNLFLAQTDAPPKTRRLLEESEVCLKQASDIVSKLLTFSRGESAGEFRPLALHRMVDNVETICRKTFDRGIAFEIDIDPGLPAVLGDGSQLEHVLLNLCLNARDALAGASEPMIRISAAAASVPEPDDRAGDYICLRVSDNGMGMDAETQSQIFDPFFTTKGARAGTGLGLSMVYGVMQQHGGWVECESRPGRGACFSVFMPVTAPEGRPEADERAAELPTGEETLLILDDEEIVRQSMASFFEEFGYKVLVGADGREGLELYRRHREEVALVLLDMSMPDMSGLEVLDELQRLDPAVKVLIFSGKRNWDEELEDRVVAVVSKPPQPERFIVQVREAIDA